MILGLTGGIGSGKSKAAGILTREFGFRALQTDHIAQQIMREDPLIREKLINAFGKEIYQEDGSLNKQLYASRIYSDPEKKKLSDAIIHPAVWKEVRRQIEAEPHGTNIVVETALPGPELSAICDKIALVETKRSIRISRLMENRGYTREYAESILNNQKDDSWYRNHSDLIIHNDRGIDELREEVRKTICC